ncbi:MAG TPA: DUF6714 family protein [Solirubrobacteraceae bacterium]
MTDADDRRRLAEKIEAAFADVPRAAPPLTDGGGPTQDDVETALAGKDAGELTADDARAVRLDLWSLTAEAFRYYVPALAHMTLAGDEEVDGLDEGVFDVLTPPADDAGRARFDERMGLLNEGQREALGDFACWFSAQVPELAGADAARAYWRCD